jgi:hypothetical protein
VASGRFYWHAYAAQLEDEQRLRIVGANLFAHWQAKARPTGDLKPALQDGYPDILQKIYPMSI